MRNRWFSFLLGITAVPGEIENNACAKFGEANKVHFGRCANGELAFLGPFLFFREKSYCYSEFFTFSVKMPKI